MVSNTFEIETIWTCKFLNSRVWDMLTKKCFIMVASTHGNPSWMISPRWRESPCDPWVPNTKGQKCGALMFSLMSDRAGCQATSLRWFETPGRSCDVTVMNVQFSLKDIVSDIPWISHYLVLIDQCYGIIYVTDLKTSPKSLWKD